MKLTLYLIWTCIDSRLIPNKLLHLKYWLKEDLINNEAASVSNVSFLLSIKLHWYEFIEVSLKGFFNVSQRSRNGWEIEKTSTRDVTLLMKWSLNQGSFSAFFPSNNRIFSNWVVNKKDILTLRFYLIVLVSFLWMKNEPVNTLLITLVLTVNHVLMIQLMLPILIS